MATVTDAAVQQPPTLLITLTGKDRPGVTSTVFSLANSMYFLLHISAECMPQHGPQ